MEGSGLPLAIVVKGYPRLSETFVARELEAIERLGLPFSLHALRNPGSDAALTRYRVSAACQYLPEYLHDAPLVVSRALVSAALLPRYRHGLSLFARDFARDRSRARIRRFGQACVLATRIQSHARHIYCHFSHSPASVARYAAAMLGIGYSISAHAKDAWTDPSWDLKAKLEGAGFVTTCNTAALERLKSVSPGREVQLIHHGIDKSLVVTNASRSSRDGRDPEDPVRILAVARAVEKKGLRHLLEALKRLPSHLHFRLDHYGGGPLLPALVRMAKELDLDERITFHGAKAHGDIISAMDRADLLVFPADVAEDGDRDGIPNVILEANARGLSVVACDAGSICEVVQDLHTGALAVRADAAALSERIKEAVRSPDLRRIWANNARMVNMGKFDAEAGYERLSRLLQAELTPS